MLTDFIVVKAGVLSDGGSVVVLAVQDEGVGRSADFDFLLGAVDRLRGGGSALVELTARAGREDTDADGVGLSVILDLGLSNPSIAKGIRSVFLNNNIPSMISQSHRIHLLTGCFNTSVERKPVLWHCE